MHDMTRTCASRKNVIPPQPTDLQNCSLWVPNQVAGRPGAHHAQLRQVAGSVAQFAPRSARLMILASLRVLIVNGVQLLFCAAMYRTQ